MPAERRSLRSRTSLTSHPSPASPKMGRPRRGASGNQSQAVTVARSESRSPEDAKKSIHLTVKMPSSKLREATSGKQKNVSVNSRDSFVGGEIINGPRGSRAKRSIVVESESEDEEEDDEVVPSDQEMDEDEEDDEEEDEEEEAEADSADADADADGDVEMDAGAPLHPRMLKMTGPSQKPSVVVTPAQDGKMKSVESKEMEMEDDDEELSELDSEAEAEDADEDAEGEVDEMNQDEEGRSPGTGSRASTPDISKMTKRQRSRLDQVMAEGDFLQLPMGMFPSLYAPLNSTHPLPSEPQTKKHFTAEEHAMRRAEMARRRKNLSEKRNEEEKVCLLLPISPHLSPAFNPSLAPTPSPLPNQKNPQLTPLTATQMDTINRLLKKQAPKRRGKLSAAELSANGAGANGAGAGSDADATPPEVEKANPVFVRWVSDARGCRLGVPEDWVEAGVMRGVVGRGVV